MGDWVRGVLEFVFVNLLLLSFLFLALALIALFFIGLRAISAGSPGREVELSRAVYLIKNHRVAQATLYDQDSRVGLVTRAGEHVWAAYPQNSYANTLLATLEQANTPTTVDPQSTKASLRVVVQFLLPILILVTLFAFCSICRSSVVYEFCG